MANFRLKAPITAVAFTADGLCVMRISPGVIVQIPDIDRETGMIETVCSGRRISLFIQDVRKHGERIDPHIAS